MKKYNTLLPLLIIIFSCKSLQTSVENSQIYNENPKTFIGRTYFSENKKYHAIEINFKSDSTFIAKDPRPHYNGMEPYYLSEINGKWNFIDSNKIVLDVNDSLYWDYRYFTTVKDSFLFAVAKAGAPNYLIIDNDTIVFLNNYKKFILKEMVELEFEIMPQNIIKE